VKTAALLDRHVTRRSRRPRDRRTEIAEARAQLATATADLVMVDRIIEVWQM
jgi:hypothetical protein